MPKKERILDGIEDVIRLHQGAILDVRRAAAVIAAQHNRKHDELIMLIILKRAAGAQLVLKL